MENALNDTHLWMVHLGFALLAASYLVRDMLWLRTIAVCSSMLMITFNLIAYKFPIWGIIGWNVFFICINIYNLVKLVHERAGIRFSDDEQWLFDTVFPHLAPHQFRKLCEIADWERLPEGTELARENAPMQAMFFIREGRLTVLSAGQAIATILPGTFVGEMAFLTGAHASADVRTAVVSEAVSWRIDALQALCAVDSAVRGALQGVLASDLVDKLKAQSRAGLRLDNWVDEASVPA